MIGSLLCAKALEVREVERLYRTNKLINKVINKHARKLVRVRLYLRWENKYKDKKFKLFFTRLVTLDLTRNIESLTFSINTLNYLVDSLEKGIKDYLKTIKNS